jgi:hypothetical protein
MTRVDRIAGCFAIALAIACPYGRLYAHDAPAAPVQQAGEAIEDAGDDVADWILRLFRGVDDDDVRKPKRGGGKGSGGGGRGTGGAGSGGGGDDDGGGDDGGDDGGGDD